MTKVAMNKEQIIQAVTPAVEQRGCFLVDVSVSADNDIEIVIEKEEGIVDWEDCAAIDQVMHAAFNQDEEDYALTVSSAGLDRPFKVFKQFLKAKGSQVDVKFKGGKRLVATLEDAWKGRRKRKRWNIRTPVRCRRLTPLHLILNSSRRRFARLRLGMTKKTFGSE